MTLADLFAAIDRVAAGQYGFFSTPSKSEYVVDPRSQILWDIKPVFGLLLENLGNDVRGGVKPLTVKTLKDRVWAHLPDLHLVSFPTREKRRLGLRRDDERLPFVDWQGAVVQPGPPGPPLGSIGWGGFGAAPFYMALTRVYLRDPSVVLAARDRATGHCEHCRAGAPFRTFAGLPYLEVHHIIPLSAGGADQLDNVIALCPNCHRKAHFGETGLV